MRSLNGLTGAVLLCAAAVSVTAQTLEEPRSTTDSRPAPKSAEVPLSSGGAGPRPALALAERIESLRTQFPGVGRGHIGYKFVDLPTGAVVAANGSATFFTPASNTKLYTTAAALVRLGPEYRFRTEVRATAGWQNGQPQVQDLLLIGGGDPNLSGRTVPYLVDAEEGDTRRALKELADEVWETGIREIRGHVEAVDTRYSGPGYPDGWTIDDSTYSYGAPVSALVVNDNSVALILRPSQVGELATVELSPATPHFVLSSQVTTVAGKEAHITVGRPGLANELVLHGTIGLKVDEWREDVALDDAPLWAAEEFATVLRERGIAILGSAEVRAEADACTQTCAIVATRESAPLSQVVQVINKVSQNLHAEMLLRELAVAKGEAGTLEMGLKERQAFLEQAGIPADGTSLADGSGLARQNLTSPDATIALLRYMWERPEREAWLQSLPIGGIDGSLQKRFRKIAGAQRVHAKTGSLSRVNTLSGYLEKRSGGWMAFSVMVNATGAHDADVRLFIDKLCEMMLQL